MSKNRKESSFSYEPQNKLPKLNKVQEKWDLKNLYYSSEKDKAIEADIIKTEKAYSSFAKKYKDGKWQKNTKSIVKAVKDYLKLSELPGSRPLYYFWYRKELDSRDATAEKLANLLETRLIKAGNQVLFFELALARLPKSMQRTLLKDKSAKAIHFYLKSTFEHAKYQLTEPEERILGLKSNTSRGLWVTATEKVLNKQTIKWKGKELSISGALMQFENLPHKEAKKMYDKIIPVLKNTGEIAESELTALALDKQTNDELRGYEKPYSSTVLNFDSNEQTLENLVEIICKDGYKLSNRFYKLKKKLIGRDLNYLDRNEALDKLPAIDYKTGVSIVRDVFYGFDYRYGKIFDEMLENGHIDVWPQAGKGGGAFCSSGVNKPTLVMLNHNDSFESLRTLAHEMGHAIHAYRSKAQPSWYSDHSTLTAETASTFFESLVAEALIEKAEGKTKINLLHNSIADRLMTMVMCIARFQFELEMHETIRKEGGMSTEELAAGLAKHFKRYAGPVVDVTEDDGLIVVSKPHYRMNFYQYSYSFGEIASSIMRNRYYKDNSFKEQVDKYLHVMV